MTDEVSNVSQDDKNLAMLAHLLTILFSFLPSLIIWIMNKDKAEKEFVADQAKEVLNFVITVVLAYIACTLLTVALTFLLPVLALVGTLLFLIIGVGALVLLVMGGLAAGKGVKYRYPVALRLLK